MCGGMCARGIEPPHPQNMSTDEQTHLGRIDGKIDELARDFSDLRVMLARLESRQACPSPGLCLNLQRVMDAQDRRLASIERWRTWLFGVAAAAALVCGVAWESVKTWFLKK